VIAAEPSSTSSPNQKVRRYENDPSAIFVRARGRYSRKQDARRDVAHGDGHAPRTIRSRPRSGARMDRLGYEQDLGKLRRDIPGLAARLVIATETGLGIALVITAFFFLRGANRIWEAVGGIALAVSAFVATGLWLIVGRPPFWPDGNGYGSGWPIEFFLISISAALAFSIALADPDGTVLMHVTRLVRRRN
jgi:hypothetical protein